MSWRVSQKPLESPEWQDPAAAPLCHPQGENPEALDREDPSKLPGGQSPCLPPLLQGQHSLGRWGRAWRLGSGTEELEARRWAPGDPTQEGPDSALTSLSFCLLWTRKVIREKNLRGKEPHTVTLPPVHSAQ